MRGEEHFVTRDMNFTILLLQLCLIVGDLAMCRDVCDNPVPENCINNPRIRLSKVVVATSYNYVTMTSVCQVIVNMGNGLSARMVRRRHNNEAFFNRYLFYRLQT